MSDQLTEMKDKVCVITGGAGVIGQSLAKALASVGAKTVIADLNLEKASETASQITDEFNVPSLGLQCNVLDKDSLIESKKIILGEYGQIDILINGAGGNSPKATTSCEMLDKENIKDLAGSFYGLETEGFDFVFDLNFKGTLLPTMVFTEEMAKRGNGVVLNISSMNSFKPLTKIPAYSAAKAAVNNFTEWLSVHLAKTGIRVNAIAPGFFLTNQNRFLLLDENEKLTPRGQRIIDGTPMGKFGKPEELNGTVLYLLSDMSKFVTGIVIPVDGGFNAYSGV
jgi:NAD(P)-dependent dehydrogenase (short-subunit alcohol dehydrogenase family)